MSPAGVGTERRSGHRALRGLAVVVVLAGLALVVAPVADWFELDMGPFGSVTASGLGEVQAIDGNGIVESESDAGPGSPDWIIGQIPDGVVLSVLGVVVIGLAATWLARSVDRRRTVSVRRAGAVAALLGTAGVAWAVWSWVRMASTIDRQRADLDQLDPLSQLVVDQAHLEPGLGLLGAGAASLIVAVAGLRATIRGTRTALGSPMVPIPGASC